MKNQFREKQRELESLPLMGARDAFGFEEFEDISIKNKPGLIPPMALVQHYGAEMKVLYKRMLCEKPGGGLIDLRKLDRLAPEFPGDLINMLHQDSIFCAWSISKNVFRFDQSLFDAILDGDLQEVTTDMLDRVPYYTMYIDSPSFYIPSEGGKKAKVKGIIFSHRKEFRYSEEYNLGNFFGITSCFHDSDGPMTSHLTTFHENSDKTIASVEPFTASVISNLLLYIVTYMADIRSENNSESISYPKFEKGQKGGLIPAKRLKIWHVGRRLGRLIREFQIKERIKGSHASPSPHIRRAHWHTYLTGPKKNIPKDQRKRVLKWIPPIPVAMYEQYEREIAA